MSPNLKKLFRFFGAYKKQMIFAPLFKFFETITDIVIPFLVANMIDIGVKKGRDVGLILNYLLEIVIKNNNLNHKKELA